MGVVITNPKNPTVKHLRSLMANRKARRHERLFVIEGVRAVEEALRSHAQIAFGVYNAEQLADSERGRAVLAALREQRGVQPASPEVIAAVSDTVTPQGVVLAVGWPALTPQRRGITLVLDALQDPGNVGTLLRAAEATAVAQVICISGTADVYSPKVVRAAMGAHFRLPIVQDVSWEQAPALLADADHIYAAVPDATMPYYAADWRQPAALIIGNEANGISAAGLALATKRISIPMAAPVESLNAAVAGSVILFEAYRQRRLGRS
ncbi:RNA methyltransferase [Kallotenue papyrolyticum]|uniref:TrmH family RNA methyltransferase n=1 Tax=Kallotenue papyrolyticum TaxID=1325125 RepID=UPI0004ADEE9C